MPADMPADLSLLPPSGAPLSPHRGGTHGAASALAAGPKNAAGPSSDKTPAKPPAKAPSKTARLRARLGLETGSGTLEGQTGPSRRVVTPDQPTLNEVFAQTAADAAAPGFALAHLDLARGPVVWVQDRLSRKEAGRPYLPGLPPGLSVIAVEVSRPVDVLWAMEEALGCRALAGVLGEIWGDPPALSFTATKRLALRAEAHGVPAWLVRRGASADLSAARARWRLASLPAEVDPHDRHAPGAPLWKAELFRARWQKPGTWVASYDGARHRLELTDTGGGEMAQPLHPPARQQHQSAAG